MRKILFRGKRICNGEWVYGYLAPSYIRVMDGQSKVYWCIFKDDEIGDMYACGGTIQMGSTMKYEIDIDTAGEYTGLTDKNGTEIFEGDVLTSLYKGDGCKGVYLIKFKNGMFYPQKNGEHQQKYLTVCMSDMNYCDVIGNAHDNPELLEVKI